MRELFPVVVHTLMWRRGAGVAVATRRSVTSTVGTRCRAVIQRGEGIVECAVREIREETGIAVAAPSCAQR